MNVHHNLNTVHRGTDIWIQRHRWHPVDQWSRWQWSTAGINDAIIRRRWWLQSHTHRHKRRWALHMVRYSTLGCWRHCLRFPIPTLTMCITVRNKYDVPRIPNSWPVMVPITITAIHHHNHHYDHIHRYYRYRKWIVSPWKKPIRWCRWRIKNWW